MPVKFWHASLRFGFFLSYLIITVVYAGSILLMGWVKSWFTWWYFSQNIFNSLNPLEFLYIKFRYCEKATKFGKMSHFLKKLLSKVKTRWEIFSNFCDLPRISDFYYIICIFKRRLFTRRYYGFIKSPFYGVKSRSETFFL